MANGGGLGGLLSQLFTPLVPQIETGVDKIADLIEQIGGQAVPGTQAPSTGAGTILDAPSLTEALRGVGGFLAQMTSPGDIALNAVTGGLVGIGRAAIGREIGEQAAKAAIKLPTKVKPAQTVTTKVTGKGAPALKAVQQKAVQQGTAPAPKQRDLAQSLSSKERAEMIKGRASLQKDIKQRGGDLRKVSKETLSAADRAALAFRRESAEMERLMTNVAPETVEAFDRIRRQRGTVREAAKIADPAKALARLGLQDVPENRFMLTLVQVEDRLRRGGKGLNDAKLKAMREALGEMGSIARILNASLGGATVGGVTGGAIAAGEQHPGEDPYERIGRMIVGAGIGAGTGALTGGVLATPIVRRGEQAVKRSVGEKLTSLQITSMLGDVGSIGRSVVGSSMGMFSLAGRRILEGRPELASKGLREAFSPQGLKRFFDAIEDPNIGQATKEAGKEAGQFHHELARWEVPTRIINANDVWARGASKAMGFSDEEAQAAQLIGRPLTKAGQKFSETIEALPFGTGTVVAPFQRVAIRGIERTFEPFMSQLPTSRRALTGAENITAARAGEAAEEPVAEHLPGFERSAGVLAGPAFVPALMGMAGGRTFRETESPTAALRDVGLTLAEQVAGGGRAVGESIFGRTSKSGAPGEVQAIGPLGAAFAAGRTIPGISATMARIRDPEFARVTSPEEVREEAEAGETEGIEGIINQLLVESPKLAAPFAARIPGARELLPGTGVPLDVTGQPRVDPEARTPLARALAPISPTLKITGTMETGTPRAPLDRPSIRFARTHGITLETPKRKEVEKLGPAELPVPEDARLAAAAAERGPIFDVLDTLVSGESFQALPEEAQIRAYKLAQDLAKRLTKPTGALLRKGGAFEGIATGATRPRVKEP